MKESPLHAHGFTLLREERLEEVGGIVRLWRHDVTGAELLSVLNDDETSPSASVSALRPKIPPAWRTFWNTPFSAARKNIR